MPHQLSLPLTLVPSSDNSYPLLGLLIQGAAPKVWLAALMALHVEESQVLCYPIPDRHPNQIWGCLVAFSSPIQAAAVSPHLPLQCAHDYLFLPEHSQFLPVLEARALGELLLEKSYLLHPTLGLVELFEPLDWATLFVAPTAHPLTSQAPEEGVPLPNKIQIFTVEAAPVEESLGFLDAVVPEREDLQDAPLTAAEVFRLRKLRAWKEAHLQQQNQPEAKGLWARLQEKIRSTPPWTEELEQELQALESRYQNPMNRLVDLLKEDPEKALKYAIPLNNNQIGRGYGQKDGQGTWDWMPRWANTTLFQSNSDSGYNSGRSYAVPNEQYYELQKQYRASAEQLIREGKYDKAAFIYLRLLRTPKIAAETLMKGELYEEAASIHLKYLNDEASAAFCYEKANRLEKALELYKKLEKNNKVGELYQQLGKPELAAVYYEKVLTAFLENKKYHTAAHYCKDKLQDEERAYELAFAGWFHGKAPVQCLQYCIEGLESAAAQREFLENFYQENFTDGRLLEFLQVLRAYYNQKEKEQTWVRALAYLVITDHAEEDVNLLRQLLYFNDKDMHLSKDILRHRLSKDS